MAPLSLAQVGCGGMGLRHVYGLMELRTQGFDVFDLVALCDKQLSAVEHVASEAERVLGKRPKTYTDFDEMLEKEPGVDAVDVVTDTRFHHVFTIKALEAGKHVAVQKPMALTVRACRKMIETAKRAGKILSVSETSRRDPTNRLVRALLEYKVLGEPRLAVNIGFSGTRTLGHGGGGAWRHMKLRGGYFVEHGVHTADLLLYYLGDVSTVYAQTALWEKARHTIDRPAQMLEKVYGHRVKEEIDQGETVECTAEDTALAMLQFSSGALGQWSVSIATPGQPTSASVIYCSEGSIALRNPVQVIRAGEEHSLSDEEILALVPHYQLDDLTAPFFQGERRLSSHRLPWTESDRKLAAMQRLDFAQAILEDREPEVTGETGMKGLALCYAVLESGYVGKPISFDDVVEDRVNAYQEEINHDAELA